MCRQVWASATQSFRTFFFPADTLVEEVESPSMTTQEAVQNMSYIQAGLINSISWHELQLSSAFSEPLKNNPGAQLPHPIKSQTDMKTDVKLDIKTECHSDLAEFKEKLDVQTNKFAFGEYEENIEKWKLPYHIWYCCQIVLAWLSHYTTVLKKACQHWPPVSFLFTRLFTCTLIQCPAIFILWL